jgi:hypothetical protein
MKNHEMVTLLHDDQRLAELEKTIARGKKTFVEVGLALAEIRDLRLYRREYAGFDEYCRMKWGWAKAYANYVIRGADVVKSLPEKLATIVATETQARELAKIPAEDRAEVLQALVDSGEPVTAAAIKRQLPPVPAQSDNGRPSGPSLPPPPALVVDATGWPIPTQLIPLWLRSWEVQEMLTTLSRVKGALRTAQESKDPLFTEVLFSSALSQLDQAWTDIKTAKPFAVCPTCQGQVPEQCRMCHGRGLISEFRWNTCVTREDKEFRTKAMQK